MQNERKLREQITLVERGIKETGKHEATALLHVIFGVFIVLSVMLLFPEESRQLAHEYPAWFSGAGALLFCVAYYYPGSWGRREMALREQRVRLLKHLSGLDALSS